jgi:replicative DNA helicase
LSVELSLLNAVIASRDFSLLVRSGLADESTWHEYPEAYRFIHDHVREFGETPSIESVVEASVMKRWANEFERVETVESFSTMVAKKHDMDAKIATERLLRDAAKKYGTMSGVELVAKIEREVREIRDRLSLRSGQAVNWTTTAKERLSDYIAKVENGVEDETIPLFWDVINDAVGGFHPGDYVDVEGVLKRGKTFVGDVNALIASNAGFRVLKMLAETTKKDDSHRLDTLSFGVNMRRLSQYRLTDGELQRYQSGLMSMSGDERRGDIILEDQTDWPQGLTLEQIEASVERHRPDVLIIDQFNLIVGGSKWEAQAERSRWLRQFFARKNIVGVVITQANGDHVKDAGVKSDDPSRELRPPDIGDYSGTIAVRQDCTHLIALDSVVWNDPDGKSRGKAMVAVRLSRTGGAGTSVELDWSPADGIIRPREPRRAEDAF